MAANQHGIIGIQTSALRLIADEFAFMLFSAGIIGTGLLEAMKLEQQM